MVRRAALALVCVVAAGRSQASPPAGHWDGSMTSHGVAMAVSVDFAEAAGVTTGRFTSPTQRTMDYPLDDVRVAGSSIAFGLGGATRFDGRIDGARIAGSFDDDDESGTFELRRGPAKPLPYAVTDVRFANGSVALSGSVVAPQTPGRHPAVVLLQGSGAETRWGSNRFIADRLARAGIVALIYDKRGSGASGGDWKTAGFDDLARDALAAATVLRRRGDVDPRHIGLHGHSQGGIVAAAAAALSPASIAFIVAEDTVAGPVWQQDLYRVRNGLDRAFPGEQRDAAMQLYTLFIDVARGIRPYDDLERASAPVSNQPWFEWLGIPPRESWLWPWYAKTGNVDTLEYWRAVASPALLVYGQEDRLVPVDDSIAALERVLDANRVGYAAWIVPRAEHNLTIHPRPGEPFFWWHAAPGVIDTVVAWIALQAHPDGR